jgi:hypothetical protein
MNPPKKITASAIGKTHIHNWDCMHDENHTDVFDCLYGPGGTFSKSQDWSQCHVCNPNDAPGHFCSKHVPKSVDTVISTAAENEYITDLEQELAATEQIFTTVRLAYWKLKSKKITPELLRSWSKGGTLLGTERDNTCSFKLGDLADSINKFLEGK